jgi:hypothetical protein
MFRTCRDSSECCRDYSPPAPSASTIEQVANLAARLQLLMAGGRRYVHQSRSAAGDYHSVDHPVLTLVGTEKWRGFATSGVPERASEFPTRQLSKVQFLVGVALLCRQKFLEAFVLRHHRTAAQAERLSGRSLYSS